MGKLLYQGHASLRLTTEAGTVVYVDPFAGSGYDLPADLILVTHGHFDHDRTDLPAKKPGCRVFTQREALRGGRYGACEAGGVQVRAVPAENAHHPRTQCVGYLVRADGRLFYFAGDTSRTPEMAGFAALGIDCAFLPVDGVYNMGPEEASRCAAELGAKRCVPIHTEPEHQGYDPEKAGAFHCAGRLLMTPGTELDF